MLTRRYENGESRGVLLCAGDDAFSAAMGCLHGIRVILEQYLQSYPEMRLALEPWEHPGPGEPPAVVRRMIDAAREYGVGPMAAVAGALVDEVYLEMEASHRDPFVMENGGEILVIASRLVTVALHAGNNLLGDKVGFSIPPGDEGVRGIGTSSARFGHAMSFGHADTVTVFCKWASLADAAATAVCNATTAGNDEKSIHAALAVARCYSSITGVFIVQGDRVGSTGRLPSLVSLERDNRGGLTIDPAHVH